MRERKTMKHAQEKRKPKAVRAILIAAGCLCVILGAVGVALPVLPTTPFLLVAAICFAKSSEKLDAWFKSTRLYKSHLETVRCGEGMTWPAKGRIMATVTLVMGFAEYFMLRAWLTKGSRGALIGCIVMAIVWVCHIVAFCFIVKTCPKEKAEKILRAQKEGIAYDAE